MVAWLALIISSLGLIVTIISNREKLASAYTDFKAWQYEREQKKKALDAITKYNAVPKNQENEDDKIPFKTFLLILSFPLGISSGLVSILKIESQLGIFITSSSVYTFLLLLGIIGLVIAETKNPSLRWYHWVLFPFGALLFISFYCGLWSAATTEMATNGVPGFWAGIISAIGLSLFSWALQYKYE